MKKSASETKVLSEQKKSKRIGNFKLFFAAMAVVMVWRGVWGLLDLYLFPEMSVLSYSFSIMLGVLFLLLDDGVLDELRH